MKPFIAITVLVAASLTAASAAPAQQQQVAAGSGANRLGNVPSLSSGFFSVGGSPSGSGSPAGGLRGRLVGGGGFSHPFGSLQGPGFPGGSYGVGSYQGAQSPFYYNQGYYPGQGYGSSFYGPSYYGYNNGGWEYPYVNGNNPWYSLNGYGSSYGYGSGYGGGVPGVFGGYGNFGSTSGFGGLSQAPARLQGLRPGASGSSSTLQSPARSQ